MKRLMCLILVLSIALLLISGCSTSTPSQNQPPNVAPTTSQPQTPTSTGQPQPSAKSSPTAASPTTNVIKIRYADQNPKNGYSVAHGAALWIKQIETATHGRVKIDDYFSESLCKGTAAWEATKSGVADMAWMFHGYWSNMTTLSDVVTLPFLPFKSAEQSSAIFWQLYQKYPSLQQQYKDNKVLTLWTTSPYFLITTKTHIKTADDWKGMKMRVPGGPPVDMVKLLGGVPVMTAMPDTYLNLQKGVIDGMAQNWQALPDFKQYEVVKYYTYVPTFTVYFSQAMNIQSWNSLPSDIQKQIEGVGGLQGAKLWGQGYDAATKELPEIIKKEGYPMIEYTPSQEELVKWQAVAGKPIWEGWVKKMEAAGYPEAREILNTTLGLIDTYNP